MAINFAIAAVLCFFLSSQSFPSAAADGKPYELATTVCKNTTDFNFCRDVVFPHKFAADADRVKLAYIIFNATYVNASNTNAYITSQIRRGGGGAATLAGLKKCSVYYKEISHTIGEMYGNLESDTYYEFDVDSLHIRDQATACQKAFTGRSPLARQNVDMIKLAGMCYSIALYFPYSKCCA